MWLPSKKIAEFLTFESVFIVLSVILFSLLVYQFLKYRLTAERKYLIQDLYKNLFRHLLSFIIAFALYQTLGLRNLDPLAESIQGIIGLACMISGSLVFIKASRILLFEYLFMTSLKIAVPVLLVNIFSLILSATIAGFFATYLFNMRLASLLAGSAILSVILGLALQETLGNLFSGIALQFDKPFEIDDWVEINNAGQKIIGKVYEITWRATLLIGLGDEIHTVPNRVLAQSQVTNFAAKDRPFLRRLTLRLELGANPESIRTLILGAFKQKIEGVLEHPVPDIFLVELTESWQEYRLIYYIQLYGSQIEIGDRVLRRCVEILNQNRIALAHTQVTVTHSNARPV